MRRATCLLALGILLATGTDSFAQGAAQLPVAKYAAGNTAPDLKAGIVFPAGAFDLSDKPDAMLLGRMPFPKSVAFVHDNLTYYDEYTDAGTGIKGWLYSIALGPNKRYFLVAQTGIPGLSDSQRWIIEYDDKGNPLTTFQGTFVKK